MEFLVQPAERDHVVSLVPRSVLSTSYLHGRWKELRTKAIISTDGSTRSTALCCVERQVGRCRQL